MTSVGDTTNKVSYISIHAAKACPFCGRHHFDITQAVSFYRCECGATFQAMWDEKERVTVYTWLRLGQEIPDRDKGWEVTALGETVKEVTVKELC